MFLLASPPFQTPVCHSRPPGTTHPHPMPCQSLAPTWRARLIPAVPTMGKAHPLLLQLAPSLGRKRNTLQRGLSVFVRLTNLFWPSQPASTSFPIGLIFSGRHTPALPLRFLACCLPLHAITRAQSSLLPSIFFSFRVSLDFPSSNFGPFSQVSEPLCTEVSEHILIKWIVHMIRHRTLHDRVRVYTHIPKG